MYRVEYADIGFRLSLLSYDRVVAGEIGIFGRYAQFLHHGNEHGPLLRIDAFGGDVHERAHLCKHTRVIGQPPRQVVFGLEHRSRVFVGTIHPDADCEVAVMREWNKVDNKMVALVHHPGGQSPGFLGSLEGIHTGLCLLQALLLQGDGRLVATGDVFLHFLQRGDMQGGKALIHQLGHLHLVPAVDVHLRLVHLGAFPEPAVTVHEEIVAGLIARVPGVGRYGPHAVVHHGLRLVRIVCLARAQIQHHDGHRHQIE